MFVRRALSAVVLASTALIAIPAATGTASALVTGGKEWRSLPSTTSLSWNQLASVCPQDGVTPCVGVVGGKDLTGWIWATEPQVRELFAQRYDPIFLTEDVSSSWGSGLVFLDDFGATGWIVTTYSSDEWAYGWTASTSPAGLPIGIGGGWGFPPVSGWLGFGEVANPAEAIADRGAMMWRPDVVHASPALANDDAGSTTTAGGTAVANVLANDTFGSRPATVGDALLVQTSASPGVSLDLTDGSVDVAAGTAAGPVALTYTMCEKAAPTNCDTASVAITVSNVIIDATNDSGSAYSAVGGAAVANVLANDTLAGLPATLDTVTLTTVSTSPGISLDVADGSVDVAVGTAGGVKTLTYKICQKTQMANCDTAVATVTVYAQSIIVSSPTLTITEGKSATVTVQLGLPPTANVVVTTVAGIGTTTVTRSPQTFTFTPANWNQPQTLTLTSKHDSNKVDNATTVLLTSPGVATSSVTATIRDDDRPANTPLVIIETPRNGDTLSGVTVLRATATDVGGSLVELRFYVDGVRVFTGAVGGAYSWNTLVVASGVHLIEARVTDSDGNEGRSSIKVTVAN